MTAFDPVPFEPTPFDPLPFKMLHSTDKRRVRRRAERLLADDPDRDPSEVIDLALAEWNEKFAADRARFAEHARLNPPPPFVPTVTCPRCNGEGRVPRTEAGDQ